MDTRLVVESRQVLVMNMGLDADVMKRDIPEKTTKSA
jgi:hypothetical protein